jgi:cytochrome c-type biogenesis protein CcmH
MMRWWLALLLAIAPAIAMAQVMGDPSPPRFAETAEETRFHALVSELRCVMCQNQSLADSNAQIARDLRREVLVLMRQGKSDREIQDYLVARYGEFVLYKPRIEASTWLLWFGPALLLLVGGFVVARVVHRHHGSSTVPPDDSQEW